MIPANTNINDAYLRALADLDNAHEQARWERDAVRRFRKHFIVSLRELVETLRNLLETLPLDPGHPQSALIKGVQLAYEQARTMLDNLDRKS